LENSKAQMPKHLSNVAHQTLRERRNSKIWINFAPHNQNSISMRFLIPLFITGIFLLLFAPGTLDAQEVKFASLDKSPMDVAHYPSRSRYLNYLDADDPDRTQKIKVLYSRPKKNGRTLFGELVPFGKDWRLGANEATEITFFQNVEIGQVTVSRGTYTMFAEPVNAEKWIFKLSKERFIGGSQNRDKSLDIVTTERSRLRNFLKPEELAANEPQIRVVYGRPTRRDREIFGTLVEYGKMWRLGANETTVVTFFNDVTINGEKVEAGNYGLFAKVEKEEWEFVLHKAVQSWGTPGFDEADTILTFKAKTEKTPSELEAFSIALVDAGDQTVHLVAGWDDVMARMPIVLGN